MSALPRVLLVEDDASIRRFVTLALDESPVQLRTCETVAEALQILAEGGVALVITDLMLPGESGLGLAERLAQTPGLARGARLAVFSAGVTPEVQQRLDALGVWRTLRKPASVLDIEACVSDALALWNATPPSAAPPAAALPSAAHAAQSPAQPTPASQADETAAIAAHFAGNAALFKAYRTSCHAQFPHDQTAGDAAAAAGDAAALRRLGHSLATVLLTLGRPADSALARALEATAAHQDLAAAAALWQRLRERLAAPLPG